MYRLKTQEGIFSEFKVVEEKKAVVFGLQNVYAFCIDSTVHIKWDIPKIWTPQNFAMQLYIETKVYGKGVDVPEIDKDLQGVSFRATKGVDYVVEATPLLICLGKNYGPTTKILVRL
ncbi:hypothetical protein ISTM_129 [Insectomime virus]|nr:hypothetical protein ISTM_129 [Insectomime virus]